MKNLLFLLLSFNLLFGDNFSWQGNLNWQNNFKNAKELAMLYKKPIFMFLDSRSCFYCPKLKKEVLSKKNIQEKIKKNFIPLLLDNAVDADSDVPNSGHVPLKFSVSMTPAIYFMGPNEEKLARKGNKHMIIYGMWKPEEMLEWMDGALSKYEKLYGVKYAK